MTFATLGHSSYIHYTTTFYYKRRKQYMRRMFCIEHDEIMQCFESIRNMHNEKSRSHLLTKKILSDFFLKMIMAYRNNDDLQIFKFGNLNEKMCFGNFWKYYFTGILSVGVFPFLIYKRL